jgi:hypothetical protein
VDDQRLFNVIENILAEYIKNSNRNHVDTMLIRESVSTLNNLLIENEKVATHITKSTNIYRILIKVMTPLTSSIVIAEIMLFFTFLYKASPQSQKKKILKGEFIESLIKLLDMENSEIVYQGIETLSCFWDFCESYSEIDTEIRLKFIQFNLKEKLECLILNKSNSKLSQSAENFYNILDVKHSTYN